MKRWMRIGVLLIPLIAGGCWDRIEINDIGLVMGTGLDLAENNNILATLQIAVPSPSVQLAGGVSKEADRFFTISAVGKSGMDLDRQLQKKMSRTLSFSHRSVLLIGEALARKGINDILDTFSRNPRNRLKTYIMVVKGGTARDLLKDRYPYEITPADAINEMESLKGEGVITTLRDFLIESASEGTNPTVGVLEQTQIFSSGRNGQEKQFRLNGTAIFNNSALVGFLDNSETHELLWFKGNKKTDNIFTDLPEGKGNVGFMVTNGKVKIVPDTKGDTLKFHIEIKGDGNLFENNSQLDVTESNNLELIKEVLEKRVEDNIKALLKKIQTKYKADIVGFGEQLQRTDPKRWDAVKKNWDREFAAAEVTLSVNLTIKNTGVIGPSLQLKEKEIIK